MSRVQPQSTRSCFCRHIAHSHVSSLAPLPLVTDRFLFRHISHSHVSRLDPPSTRHGQVSVQTHITQSCLTSRPALHSSQSGFCPDTYLTVMSHVQPCLRPALVTALVIPGTSARPALLLPTPPHPTPPPPFLACPPCSP